jgi:hypothetical protein
MSDKELRLKPLFDAMDKAGGTKQPDFKTLTFKEKFKIGFSIWAFLFAIFYYLYHGMWKKGLSLLLVCMVLGFLVQYFIPSFPYAANLITSVLFATRAPINLYSKYKLNDDGWNFLK